MKNNILEDLSVATLADALAFQAKNRPDAMAFTFEGHTLTFRQFNHHVDQTANGFISEGLQSGAKVAYLGKDTAYGYEILFACAKARSVFIGINWRLAAQEVKFILNDGEAEILFVGEEFFSLITQIQDELEHVKKIISIKGTHPEWDSYPEWRSANPASPLDFSYDPEDVVVQMYTSGTTGHPKGVQLANYSFFRLMQGMQARGDRWMDLNPEDKLLLSLPIFHIGGLWWAVQGFLAGAQGIIIETFVGWQVLELISSFKITKVVMVPAMVQFVLAEPSCEETDFSSLKGFLYGGSPIAPALMRKAMETFDCDFFQIYGMTETGNMAVCLRPEDHTPEGNERMKAAGRPLPGVEARIMGRDGKDLPSGQIGEVCLKSPSNMVGYWKREEATAETLVDGWIRTGDAGYRDAEGYIYVCDRIKDMIICSGENVYPAEVEAVLSEHEAVAEVAVIGVPDERWGEVVKAFVVLRQGFSAKQRELINFTRERIADFKVPKTVDFVEALPRNPSGKILKRTLRQPFWEGKERQVN